MEPGSTGQSTLPAIASSYTPTPFGGSVLGVPSEQELMVYNVWAKTAVDSQMYRGIGKEAGVMMVMLAAREFGIGPAQALNGGLNIIEGKVELSARMMSGLIRRAKHSIQVLENTDKQCILFGKRRDTGDSLKVVYTIEEAKEAGLVKEKGAWKRTPKDMLFARALTRLARQLFSDVIGIGYVEGEISGKDPEELEVFNLDSEDELIDQLMQGLDKEDGYLMLEFVNIVMNHYKWDKLTTIREFLKDLPSTKEKFNKWKAKKAV